MRKALGLIESVGLSTAVSALDAASKAADVELLGVEKVIGIETKVGVTIHLAGEVAAVRAAVDAGVEAGNRVGRVVASHVIPNPHDELDKMIEKFKGNLKVDKVEEKPVKKAANTKKNEETNKEEK